LGVPALSPHPPSPAGLKRNPCWVERFNVQFLGSVEVPYHQGNGILCAAMQKVSEPGGHRVGAAPSPGCGNVCAEAAWDPRCPPPQIATTRKLTVHLRPPASCDLEITLQGIKLILTVNEYSRDEEVRGRGGSRVMPPPPHPHLHSEPGGSYNEAVGSHIPWGGGGSW